MAKLQDKFYNRVIEGELKLSEEEKKNLVESASSVKILENIQDKDGHNRFIEGDITMETIEGVTQTYGKWSLSGTHLMIVLAGNIADTTALSWGTKIANINVPEWVEDKLVPIFAAYYVDVKNTPLYGSDLGAQNVLSILRKQSDGLSILFSNITANSNRSFRIVFDFLIDNE